MVGPTVSLEKEVGASLAVLSNMILWSSAVHRPRDYNIFDQVMQLHLSELRLLRARATLPRIGTVGDSSRH
jgi:hypothetical protein